LGKRRDGVLVLLKGINLGAAGKGEGEGADPGEEVGHALGAAHALLDQSDQHRLSLP
jgi:hypothetical protein